MTKSKMDKCCKVQQRKRGNDMSYFMVLTNAGYWGVGDTLTTAKKNAHYNKSSDDAKIIEWNQEPSDWRISHMGEVMWSDAEIVQEYYLRKPHGKKEKE